jgi:hypothetical protein
VSLTIGRESGQSIGYPPEAETMWRAVGKERAAPMTINASATPMNGRRHLKSTRNRQAGADENESDKNRYITPASFAGRSSTLV